MEKVCMILAMVFDVVFMLGGLVAMAVGDWQAATAFGVLAIYMWLQHTHIRDRLD